ncbi:uncharacterized protein A4U43_C03F15450 [Asparagus officinalis]|uniref:FBD domain-containing protein n=1 Tax=Asparagus officinalis TaxID=4686 RepID=A0A5P1FC30_ASPOF|nr:putative F-box protein At1g49610 [Asparagus officinalis]ONK75303.1 uncharacterized protein A4U43_C03F15450 [Asparagus officinalis]
METSSIGKAIDNRDRLSELPQNIIDIILSKLTTKTAIKNTSILSKPWRDAWITCPKLVLKRQEFCCHHSFVKFVERVLAIRATSSITAFELYWTNVPDVSCISTWLHYAMRHNVQEIVLHVHSRDMLELPTSFFRCPTLKHLDIDGSMRLEYPRAILNCFLKLPNSLNLINLRYLHLNFVKCTQELLEKLISSCALLESLRLGVVFENIEISALNLKTLYLDYIYGTVQISTPKLESLSCNLFMFGKILTEDLKFLEEADVWCGGTLQWSVDELTKFWSQLSNAKVLNLTGGAVESLSGIDLSYQTSPVFSNLKQLTIRAPLTTENINVIITLLRRSPNLEKLVLHNNQTTNRLVDFWGDHKAPWQLKDGRGVSYYKAPRQLEDGCGFPNLKDISISSFLGERTEYQLVKFFLEEANTLQMMTIYRKVSNYAATAKAICEKLLAMHIASPHAKVLITDDFPRGNWL